MPRVCSPLAVLRTVIVLAASLLLSSLGVLTADEPDSLEDLKARMAALERQNQRLLKSLEQRRPLHNRELDDATGVVQASHESDPNEVFANEGDDPRIRSIVEEYLAEREARNAAAEPHQPPEPAPLPDAGNDLSFRATWKNGMELETRNKDFRVHVGGRTHFDGSWYHAGPAVTSDPSTVALIRDGVDFRRARLRIDGTMYEVVDWAAEYDFMNSSIIGTSVSVLPSPTDLWITLTHLPIVGNFRIGNQKEPIGFERLVSSRYLPFMERSFNQDAFYQGFNNGFVPGMLLFDTALDERATWAVGFFKPTNNSFAFNTGGGEYSATGRFTLLPVDEDEGRRLLHLGVSGRTAGLDEGLVTYRTRGPERSGVNAIWPLYAGTPAINGSGQHAVNAEVASVWGPLSFQADYLFNFVQSAFLTGGPVVGTVFYHGGYVEALYFLTGEHRAYNRKAGVFDRVVPRENFHSRPCGDCRFVGGGAWQFGVRYNHLNLNDHGINGGRLNDLTFGLNWFLNPNLKIQWNYSLTARASAVPNHDGPIQGFGMRVAHDF